MVRARPIAGDQELRDDYLALRAEILAKPSSAQSENQDLASDVVAMRKKMRDNLNKSDSKLWDIKQGDGGLVDIEFLVQYWALSHSASLTKRLDHESLPFNNVDWLQLLAKHGHISQEIRDQLIDNYRTFRDIANHSSLQSQPQLVPINELQSERNKVVDLWHSTFANVEVQ